MSHLISLAAVLSLAFQAPVADNASDEEVVISVRSTGAVLVAVSVNDRGPFTFLIDTGASHTTVGTDLAERLRLPIVAKGSVSTTAGHQTRLVGRLERLEIGRACVEGLLPTVVPAAELREIESGVDGIVGQDFLSGFNYTVDYRRKRLRWWVPDVTEQDRLPLLGAGGRSLVRLSRNGQHPPLLLVPDSGAPTVVVFERKGRTAVPVEYLDQPVGVSAIALRTVGRGGLLRELKVGALTVHNLPVVVVEGTGPNTIEGDGLLPLHRFSSVSFNNQEGWMSVRR